jgi:tetratricopeptide (TPR) repeat protein
VKGRTLAALLTLLLALALVGQAVRWRNRMAASRTLSTVEALTLGVASGQIPPQALGSNLEALRRAAALDPIEVGIPIARGSQYFLLGRSEPAEEAYREALRLEPRPEAYLDLGRAQWLAGRRDEAARNFGLALRLEPHLARELPSGAAGAPAPPGTP